MFYKTIVTGLTSLCLLTLLSGCASAPAQTPLAPPLALLQDCLHPDVPVVTNGDLLRLLRAYEGSLDACNIDKRALREWAEKAAP